MATTPSPRGHALLATIRADFPAMIATLAAAEPLRRPGAMAATHRIIRQQSTRPWALSIDDTPGFAVRTAVNMVTLGAERFGNVLESIIDQLDRLEDPGIIAILGKSTDRDTAIIRLVMLTFLAHEFLHIEQQLGSDQYRDSDAYPAGVAALDYQADASALSYVHLLRPYAETWSAHELLALLTTLHVLMMHAFAQPMSRDAFDRLLIWHFQAARIARAPDVEDMFHAGLLAQPTITLTAFNRVDGQDLQPAHFSVRRNEEPETRLDMVVSLADGHGVQRLLRLTATDPDRMRRLAVAILDKDVRAVRCELEEFFLTHAQVMAFRPPDRATLLLSATLAQASTLLDADEPLTLDMPAVWDFFERAEYLVETLPKSRMTPALREVRDVWADGWLPALQAEIGQCVLGLSAKKAKSRSAVALHSIIRRVTIRLRALLDASSDSAD